MADKINAAKSISTHNNTTSNSGRQSNTQSPVQSVSDSGTRDSNGARGSAVDASFTVSGTAAAQQELQSSLNMLEETNRRIKQESSADAEKMIRLLPSVLGLTVSSAISKLKVSGFIVSRVSKQVSHSVPPGNVMTQVPGPGAAVPQGSGVHITVSDGTHK